MRNANCHLLLRQTWQMSSLVPCCPNNRLLIALDDRSWFPLSRGSTRPQARWKLETENAWRMTRMWQVTDVDPYVIVCRDSLGYIKTYDDFYRMLFPIFFGVAGGRRSGIAHHSSRPPSSYLYMVTALTYDGGCLVAICHVLVTISSITCCWWGGGY